MTTKADQTAADRLLKAAVREALRLIRDGACDYADQPEDMLRAAGESAALLLGERVVTADAASPDAASPDAGTGDVEALAAWFGAARDAIHDAADGAFVQVERIMAQLFLTDCDWLAAHDAEVAAAAEAKDANGPGWFWTRTEWSEWSNTLARLIPEEYHDDVAQETIIERFLADVPRLIAAAEAAAGERIVQAIEARRLTCYADALGESARNALTIAATIARADRIALAEAGGRGE